MYADDKVIFQRELLVFKSLLDHLIYYCGTWKLHIHVDKSNILFLRKGGMVRKCKKWHINGSPLEIVDQYAHQALLLTANFSSLELRKKLLSEVERHYLYWKKIRNVF